MKEDFDDIKFKQLFKEKAHKSGENPWFTRRVLNRLPDKGETSNVYTVEKWIYVIGIVLCGLCWGHLFTSGYFEVITVRTLIYTVMLIIGSILLLIQTVRTLVSY